MSNIYTGIELGTNSVKVVVVEKLKGKYNVLASTSCFSSGIKNGQVEDIKKSVESVQKALSTVEDMLGFPVKKVVAAIPPTNCKMDIAIASVDVANPNKISGFDVSNVLNEAIKGYELEGYEIVTSTPICFSVDSSENIEDPKGMKGEKLKVKVVISSVPKEPLYRILEVLNLSGVDTVDVAYTSTGDYFASRGEGVDTYVGCVVNIGEVGTNISIFNKGIQIKHSIVPIGSFNVDKDLGYLFKIPLGTARNLKENFCLAMEKYADELETINVQDKDGNNIELSQTYVSKVVEARLREILKVAKNEIKNLTNREIRYIIITGGLSEVQGFGYLVDDLFNGLAKVCRISTVGIRHNKYSSAFGVIKYFDDKLSLRGKSYDMVDKEERTILISTNNENMNNDNFLNKIFGHLFD